MLKNFPFILNLIGNYRKKSFWLATETWITLLSIAGGVLAANGVIPEAEWKQTIVPAILVVLQRVLKKGLSPAEGA